MIIFMRIIKTFTNAIKEHPVISEKIPKLPPKLANLSIVEYFNSIFSTSGGLNLKWTMIKFLINP